MNKLYFAQYSNYFPVLMASKTITNKQKITYQSLKHYQITGNC